METLSNQPRAWVGYVRVSRVMGREGESFRSPQQQRDEMARWIARRTGDSAGPVFQDLDVSGGTFQRPGFEQAWSWVMENPTERGFLVYDLSRFGREKVEFLVRRKQLADAGSELAAATEDVSDELSADLKALIADWYRQQTGKRWRQTITERHAEGLHHGTVPTGYLRQDKRLAEDPVMGAAIREVFQKYADGASTLSLVRIITRARGKDSSLTALRRILENRVYLGEVALNGDRREGQHPALVEPETWERVQARRRRDRATPSRAKEKKALLSGLIFCAHCGGTVTRKSGHREPILVCARHTGRDRELRGPLCEVGIGAPPERKVIEAVLQHLELWAATDTSGDRQAAELTEAVERQRAEVQPIEAQLVKIETGIANLVADRYTSDLSTEEYTAALARLRFRKDRTVADLDAARQALSDTERAAGRLLNGDQRRMVQRVTEAWKDADRARRRDMLETWVARIEIEHQSPVSPTMIERISIWRHGQPGEQRPSGLSEDVLWPVGMRLVSPNSSKSAKLG